MTFTMNTTLIVRLRAEEKKAVEKCVKNNPSLYNNPSHFSRVAVIRLLREHEVKSIV